MKRHLIGIAFVVAAVMAVPAYAVDPIEDSRIELIRNNCTAAQGAMQRVLASDRVTRINRGRAYEDTLRLLAAFNSRASLNTYNVSELVAHTATLEKQFTTFKGQYLDYEQKLRVVIDMNCKDQPAEFYNNLQRTRTSRDAIQQAISSIDKTLADYRTSLDKAAPLFAENPEATN